MTAAGHATYQPIAVMESRSINCHLKLTERGGCNQT